MSGRTVKLLVAVLAALALPARPSAHEIPPRVTVHAFVKADGDRVRVLVRAPLAAMRDVQFPESAGGFLDIPRADPAIRDAVRLWILPSLQVFEDGRALPQGTIAAARISLPSDRSFALYDDALTHVSGAALPADTQLSTQQALLDALLEFPIESDSSRFAIRPGLERLGIEVVTVLRFVTPDGVRPFEFRGDAGVVRLDPERHQAAWHFATLGFRHVLDGIDHLLFLLCLVVPLRRVGSLVVVVTAFTVAHSLTLVASASGIAPDALWFPPLVETLIAASILYMAIENAVAHSTLRRRTALAFGFGLVHGFGFSFVLTETMQFAGAHLALSLFAFNVGVEIGQVAVLIALVPAVRALFRHVLPERVGTIVLSLLVGHIAWHWMAERWSALREFSVLAPDLAALVIAVRIALGVVVLAAAVWIGRRILSRVDRAAEMSRGS